MDIQCFLNVNKRPPKFVEESDKDGESTGCNVSSEEEVVTAEASISLISAASRHCNPKQGSSSQAAEPGDLGFEKPNQIVLKTFLHAFSQAKNNLTAPGMVAEAGWNTPSMQTLPMQKVPSTLLCCRLDLYAQWILRLEACSRDWERTQQTCIIKKTPAL